MSVKVTVNLPDETVQAIKTIAEDRGTTVTEALRQVIETERFLHEETQAGKELLLKNPNDKTVQRIVFNAPPRAAKAVG
jgi:metal-responsive CopG/Arc/MetJ family transcriptional regulator